VATFALSDVDVVAVSICKGPANRKRIFLKKQQPGEELIQLPQHSTAIIRKSEGEAWSVFYTVVAEPEHHEDPGSADRHDGTDVWADADEIRKASHGFMRSGATINLQHKDMDAVGRVVENFVAPVDMRVDTPGGVEVIRKGAWVIGIEPDGQLRSLIDNGELDGVSYEGTGVRTALQKDLDSGGTHRSCRSCGAKMPRTAAKCQSCGKHYVAKAATMTHEPTVPPGGPGLFRMKGKQLPAYIQHVFNDLVESGHPHDGRTYSLAIGIVRNWSHGHDGHGNKVSAEVQAKAAAAMAEWEKLKAEAKADNVKKSVTSRENTMTLLAKIADKLGVDSAEDGLTDEEISLLAQADTLPQNDPKEDDVALTDEQKASLAKVEGIESTVQDLVKDDGRLARIEASLSQIADRLPAPQQTDEEKRGELETKMETMHADLSKAREDLDALASGGSRQSQEPDQIKKSDPDAELATALFG
jgi:hypothetical protein